MPNYDYQCAHCGHKEEILQKMMEAPLTECPQCRQATFRRKIGGGIGLQFQGSGFYITDYGNKPASPEKEKASSSTEGCGCNKPSCAA